MPLWTALLNIGCAGPGSATVADKREDDVSFSPPVFEIITDTGREDIDRYFTQGTLRTLGGDYYGGIRYYMAVLRSVPEHSPSLEAIARNWHALEEHDSALLYAQRAVNADTNDIESRRLLAELWMEAGAFDGAAAEYEQIIRQRPGDIQARYIVARTWERRDPMRALGHYLYIRDNLAEDFNSLVGLYEIYASQSNYMQAAATIRLLLSHYPDDPTLHEMLCGVWTDAGQYDSALGALKQADIYLADDTQLEPFLEAMLTLTDLRLHGVNTPAEDLQRFADSLVRVTARRLPDYPRHIYRAGMIALRLGNDSEGDRLLERAFQSEGLTAIAWTEAAILYMERSAPERLIAVLGPSAPRYNERAEVSYRIALAFEEVNRKDSAVFFLRRALESDADYGDAWSELARIQIADGHNGEGIASFENAVNADPYNVETLNDYSVTLARLGVHLEKAKMMADRALLIEPENEQYLTTRGWIAYLEKDYDAAVKYLQRAVNVGGATADRLELLGDAYLAEGEKQKGRDAYERALRVAGENNEQKLRIEQKRNADGL